MKEAPAYAGSGWSAFRNQVLEERTGWTHHVSEGVVLFPSAREAEAFFAASAQRWSACANRQFTHTEASKPEELWTVGPVSNTNGTLSATKIQVRPKPVMAGWGCQRALTVANNVVIDVSACSGPTSDAAVNIAHQIAAKVPT